MTFDIVLLQPCYYDCKIISIFSLSKLVCIQYCFAYYWFASERWKGSTLLLWLCEKRWPLDLHLTFSVVLLIDSKWKDKGFNPVTMTLEIRRPLSSLSKLVWNIKSFNPVTMTLCEKMTSISSLDFQCWFGYWLNLEK